MMTEDRKLRRERIDAALRLLDVLHKDTLERLASGKQAEETTMTDVTVLLQVARAGYAFKSDDDGYYWIVKEGYKSGPFKDLDSAAYEALAEIEMNNAYRFWKNGETDSCL